MATRIGNQLPNEGNSAAFREFGWRSPHIVARALFAMGLRPSYTPSPPLHGQHGPTSSKDYCHQWLSGVVPDWEQDVTARVARMSNRDIPHSMKGRD